MSDCNHTGMERIPKKGSAQKVKYGDNFFFFLRYEKSITVHGHRFTYKELGMEGQIPEKVVKKRGLVHLRDLFTWMYKGKEFVYMDV